MSHFPYSSTKTEAEFRIILDLIFLVGFHNVAHEVEKKNGRIDTVITEKSRIFIIEYKLEKKKGPSKKVLHQIIEKEYYAQYLSKNLPILLFGITLNTNDKSMNRYIDIHYDMINSNK